MIKTTTKIYIQKNCKDCGSKADVIEHDFYYCAKCMIAILKRQRSFVQFMNRNKYDITNT